MMMRMTPILALILLSACADGIKGADKAPAAILPPSVEGSTLTAPPPPVGAKTAEALDTTTPEQRAAALEVPDAGAEKDLGKVAVSLGVATDPGFWLRSKLVGVPTSGRVVTAGGKSVQVDLLPGDGAAQLSLAAFRALDLNLTSLPEVKVYASN